MVYLLLGGIGASIGGTSDTPWYEYKRDITNIVITDTISFKSGTELVGLFSGLYELESIEGLTNLDTSNVIDMSYMFASLNKNDIGKLKTLDVSGFNTSKVRDMRYMFEGCSELETLDVSGFDTSNVTDMSGMFSFCYALNDLDLSKFNTSKVKDMDQMFYFCKKLTSLDVSGFDTKNVKYMRGMFAGCGNLTTLDLSGFNTSKVTDMSSMFYGCNVLSDYIRGFDTSNVTNMSGMFSYCKAASLDLNSLDTSKVTDMSYMFNHCGAASIDISNLDTSRVTNMSGMFAGYNVSSDNISSLDTSNVTDMSEMFYECGLTSLDISSLDTSNVTDMSEMFSNCKQLTSLDLSNFDTSNVIYMRSMFEYCEQLTSLDLSSFDTSKVIMMNSMFNYCKQLTSLNLSSFDTSKVQDIFWMFHGCSRLLELDISSFDLSNAWSYLSWFNTCFTNVRMPGKMPMNNEYYEHFLKDLKRSMRSGRWKDETCNITYDDKDSVVIEEGHTYVYCPDVLKASLTVDNGDEADNKVTLSAVAEGGVSRYTYKFIMYNPVNNSWTLLQDYSSAKTYTWDMVGTGKRIFYVDVKDTLGNVKRSEAVVVESLGDELEPISVTAEKEESENDVTFTANAAGGTSSYTYKFIVYNKTTGTWGIVQDYSSKNTCTWTKGSAGDRDFYVDVKDSDGNVVRSKAMNVKIESTKPTAVLTPSATAISAGGKLTLTASTDKSGCTYKFLIYNPSTNQWFKLQDFSSKNTYTWTAGSNGTRQFYVDVKDANGNVTRSKVVNVTIGGAGALSVKAAVSASTTKVGDKITFTAEGAGGKAGYTYKMVVYNKTTKTWGLVQNFSTNNKITWTAGSAGDREFYIDVKDADGNVVRSSVMNVKTSN